MHCHFDFETAREGHTEELRITAMVVKSLLRDKNVVLDTSRLTIESCSAADAVFTVAPFSILRCRTIEFEGLPDEVDINADIAKTSKIIKSDEPPGNLVRDYLNLLERFSTYDSNLAQSQIFSQIAINLSDVAAQADRSRYELYT